MHKVEDILRAVTGPTRADMLKAIEAKEAGVAEIERHAELLGQGPLHQRIETIEACVKGILQGIAFGAKADIEQLSAAYGLTKKDN